ncbi:DUF2846 domain-containing protein [Gluconobacter thailandicus]|uniref:DUF2846 domain-containing protein n=1 Tax=Gluconobacter thailandicus TaxID=257438 RepID=A0AAP9JHH1_GLUTH|nr:DUF2846 domain-containing protein [Gluconobacter thailandicus]QEH95389.1 DUF2846 domain-containing protein [Gluconobacter thailandicus]
MLKNIALTLASAFLLSGCASVPLATPEDTALAKTFASPPSGKAAIYFYRDSFMGQALKRDISVDGKCVGKTANNMFFYSLVDGNKDHRLSTEGETTRHDISLFTAVGKNYFVQQQITMGVWSASSKLKVVSEEQGTKEIQGLKLAVSGNCS